MADLRSRAAELDAADPLAGFGEQFVPAEPGQLLAYLDGNSLGRPTRRAQRDLADLVTGPWGTRLIRGWTDEWMDWPTLVGDELAAAALGAAPGQTVVADSTTVLLYKTLRAAIAMRPGRDEIVLDRDNFPTDRYVAEGVAAECGATLRWIETGTTDGVTVEQVEEAVGERTAVVLLSHVAYRSGWVADVPAITAVAHRHGAVVLWDLCHSVGAVPTQLDDWDVDLAVGCTYKYLNGGPGAPAFAYVASRLHDDLRQPVQGWMGRQDPFAMAQGYTPAAGIRGMVSGTPPIVGMVPVRAGVAMLAEAGIERVRAKSLALTDLLLEVVDGWPAELGVTVASPREHERRGGHVTITRPDFREVNDRLWARGVIPDFRAPDGLRLGPAALSTSFSELVDALDVLRDEVGRAHT